MVAVTTNAVGHDEKMTDDMIKKRRWAFGITAFFAIVSVGTYSYNEYYAYLSVYLWFGFIYGMCLQYGRFCFS